VRERTHNQISGGIFFSAVIQGRNITVQLPAQVTAALSGLPAGSAAFRGRDAEVDILLGALAPQSSGNGGEGQEPEVPAAAGVMVTAVGGMAGVGKTELVVQAARTALGKGWFPGGVLFVDLFGYDPGRRLEPGQALAGFLGALGIPGEHIPPGDQDRARLYASVLAEYSAQDRRILVVLDNASSSGQVMPLVPAGHTSAIVTSRDTLGSLGARLLDLKVLTRADAVKLLHRALTAARPSDTRVPGHPDDAARIADLCGGLPLALLIIAALLAEDPARPLAAMAADLAGAATRLEELRYDDLTVRAAFGLSYQRLDAAAARLFRLLPANPGPDISTPAAAVLAGESQAVARRGLEALARANLIERGSSYGRWRMHDLVRLFADEHGRAEGVRDDRAVALRRLLGHYLETAMAADAHLNPAVCDPAASVIGDREQALAWLDTEYPNLTAAAYAAADSDEHAAIARDLPLVLARFLEWRRLFNDWIALTTSAMHAARRLSDRHGESTALNNLGNALRGVRLFDEAIAALQDAVRMYRDAGDQHGEAMALNNLGIALTEVRRLDEAISALRDAARICRDTGDRNGEGRALNNLGNALRGVRQFEEAIAALQDAARIYRDTGDRDGEGLAHNGLGDALRQLSRFDEALAAHQHAMQIYRDAGDRHGEGRALNSLGITLRQLSRFDEAIAAHRHAAQIFGDAGDWHAEGIALNNLGIALTGVGQFDEAIATLRDVPQIYREAGDQHGQGAALNSLGNALREARQFEEAITTLQAAAQIYRDTGDQHGEGIALSNLAAARIALAAGAARQRPERSRPRPPP
jgi:tetratricopeptide (TPR) repeat protein